MTAPIDHQTELIVKRYRSGGGSYAAIAAELGVPKTTVHRRIHQYLDEDERRRIEHAVRSRAQDVQNASLRAELLADLPPCGCPACDEQSCAVPEGYCHHCRGRRTNTAPQTSSEQRAVAGYPLMYCSRHAEAARRTARWVTTRAPSSARSGSAGADASAVRRTVTRLEGGATALAATSRRVCPDGCADPNGPRLPGEVLLKALRGT